MRSVPHAVPPNVVKETSIMRLGFDLDEVVVDLVSEFECHLKETYGIAWSIEMFTTYHFKYCMFDSNKSVNDDIICNLTKHANNAEFQFKALPVTGACEAINKLNKENHEIYFITSRPKQNKKLTAMWLEKNNIPFDCLEVIGHEADKGVYGDKLGLDMFVDDLDTHLDSMKKYKKEWSKGLLLFNKPWNSNKVVDSTFKKVKNWKEITDHVLYNF